MIVENRLDDARTGLTGHLKRSPLDTTAWSLLADCERKSGRWGQSVAAYEKVIALAPAGERRRAKYRAAAILQDQLGDHGRAASFLEDYVKTSAGGDPVLAEAMVRLARSYLQLGRQTRAKQLLLQVTGEHGGTRAATRASEMLKTL
jgi:cytochrome c-type biogenesis protein CcmH/NrfG